MIPKCLSATLSGVGLVVLGFVNAPQIRAQSTQTAGAAQPSFEVASVRRSAHGEGTEVHILPNRFIARACQIAPFIQIAYSQDLGEFGLLEVQYDRLVRGPDWIRYEPYDIEGKVDDSLAASFGHECGDKAFFQGSCTYRQPMLLMLQSLFADRFKLKVRRETRVGPVYALMVDKGGPKFPTSLSPELATVLPPNAHRTPCPPGCFCYQEYTTMARLAYWCTASGRPVLDQTGIKGLCYIELQYARQQNQPVADGAPQVESGPSIFTALKQQLGLKLVPTKGPVEYLVIDHIERPSEN
jgi:uncharacterized protein (TIGR03435 family)